MGKEGQQWLHIQHVLRLGKHVDDFGEAEGTSLIQNCILLLVDGKAVQSTYQLL